MLLGTLAALVIELLPLLLVVLDLALVLALILELEVEVILVTVLPAATEFKEELKFERLLDDVVPPVILVLRRSHNESTVLKQTEEGMAPDRSGFDVKDMVVKDGGRESGAEVKWLF